MNVRTLLLTGTLFPTFLFAQANVQIIHNCPTPAANTVNLWIYDGSAWGSSPAVADLEFRHQTAYLSFPSGVSTLRVAVAPDDASPAIGDTLASFAIPTLTSGENYVAIARGELGSSTAPFGISYIAGRQTATTSGQVDVNIFHGSTDAPSVAVFISPNGTTPAVPTLAYNASTGFVALPATDVNILLTTAADYNGGVAGFGAPLSALTNLGVIVYASGKLSPSVGEPAFGLYVAIPSAGASIALPAINLSRLQVAHNSPDPAVSVVDVYLESPADTFKVEDVSYKTATQYLLIPSATYNVHFAPSTSTSISGSIVDFPATLAANTNYLAIANGLTNTTAPAFANSVAVNGTAVNFTLTVNATGRVKSVNATDVDLLVYHQSPDAPTVDITNPLLGTIIDDFSYGEEFGWAPLMSSLGNVDILVKDATGTTTVASYIAPLGSFAGQPLVVMASDFLTPNDENISGLNNFGLWAFTPQGGNFVPLTATTGIDNEINADFKLFPNPVVQALQLQTMGELTDNLSYSIVQTDGKMLANGIIAKENTTTTIDVSALTPGFYILHLTQGNAVKTISFIKS